MALNTPNDKIIVVSAMFMIPLIINLVLCHPSVVLSATFTLLPLPSGASAPSSFAFPLSEQFYTGVIDGRILQFQPLTRNFVQVGFTTSTRSRASCGNVTVATPTCGRPLGLQVHRASNILYICDAFASLLTRTSSDDLATPISTVAEDQPIHFCNGVDVDQIAGDVYFTDFSAVFNITYYTTPRYYRCRRFKREEVIEVRHRLKRVVGFAKESVRSGRCSPECRRELPCCVGGLSKQAKMGTSNLTS